MMTGSIIEIIFIARLFYLQDEKDDGVYRTYRQTTLVARAVFACKRRVVVQVQTGERVFGFRRI